MNDNDIIYWESHYDINKYPYQVYRELVIENKEHPRKFELMGAWKTGCLIVKSSDVEYWDNNGTAYGFSDRWKASTPVGYDVWNYITRSQQILKEQVPVVFPKQEPIIFQHLKSLKGFGFVWAVFALHCWYPRIYPLYDQHVYRSFRYLVTDGKDSPMNINDDWQAYIDYRNYFIERLSESKIGFWRLDKALWAFGKNLKANNSRLLTPKAEKNQTYKRVRKPSGRNDDLWVASNTLGAKQKPFKWRLTNTNDLIIYRKYKSGIGSQKTILFHELNMIDIYMSNNDWVDLANNVEKLQRGTEKQGLGWFLYNKLNKTTEESQLSSHLAAIFVKVGIWYFNNKKKGMKFKKIPNHWILKLNEFYEKQERY